MFGAGVDESKDALALRTEMTDLLEADDPIDPARVVELRNAGEELRRRFADLASRAYRHDHVDAAGDARKRQLLEGPIADPRRTPGGVDPRARTVRPAPLRPC